MDVGGALTVWLVPLVCVLGIIGIEWKWKYPHFHVTDFFKADSFNQGIAILCIAIALVPLGWWIALPAGTIGMGIRAIASEDSRKMWPTRWQARSAIVVAIMIGSIFSGLGGVSKPVGATDWYILLTENPDAPNWPASEQHIWGDDEGAILVVNHVRLPGTLSPIGSGSMALWHLESSGTDEARLKQAIEEIPNIGLNADWFSLETTASGLSHDYDGQILPYTQKNVLVSGYKVAEMITVAVGTWGGEIQILTIIKLHDSRAEFGAFYTDPYGEEYVLPWLEENG